MDKPFCVVCLELPFQAWVGTCDHTVCYNCFYDVLNHKRKTPFVVECPMCEKFCKYTPDYMVREVISKEPEIIQKWKEMKAKNEEERKQKTFFIRKLSDWIQVFPSHTIY